MKQVLLTAVAVSSVAAAGAAGEPVTEMGRLAASMKPGEWKKLETKGYTRDLLRVGGHHILQYTHDATWHPESRQILFVGQGHYSDLRFVTYSADTNTWQQRPTPWWKRDASNGGRGPIGHAYDNNAVLGGFFYHQQYGKRTPLRTYEIATQKWTDTEVPKSAGHGPGHSSTLEPFPELGGLVRISYGKVHLYETGKKSWRELGKVGDLKIHPVAEYNPVRKVMVFGGGNGNKVLYRLDAEGEITKLKDVPLDFINSTHRFVLTSDPVGGEYLLVQNGDRRKKTTSKFYAYEVEKDEWRELGGSPKGGVAAPVPNYGVNVFCTYRPPEVWLYRHSAANGAK
ncbi:MAG: Kelch repeat-containing protein [Planctomycetota bacterium]|jgi:hypothetical protein